MVTASEEGPQRVEFLWMRMIRVQPLSVGKRVFPSSGGFSWNIWMRAISEERGGGPFVDMRRMMYPLSVERLKGLLGLVRVTRRASSHALTICLNLRVVLGF